MSGAGWLLSPLSFWLLIINVATVILELYNHVALDSHVALDRHKVLFHIISLNSNNSPKLLLFLWKSPKINGHAPSHIYDRYQSKDSNLRSLLPLTYYAYWNICKYIFKYLQDLSSPLLFSHNNQACMVLISLGHTFSAGISDGIHVNILFHLQMINCVTIWNSL